MRPPARRTPCARVPGTRTDRTGLVSSAETEAPRWKRRASSRWRLQQARTAPLRAHDVAFTAAHRPTTARTLSTIIVPTFMRLRCRRPPCGATRCYAGVLTLRDAQPPTFIEDCPAIVLLPERPPVAVAGILWTAVRATEQNFPGRTSEPRLHRMVSRQEVFDGASVCERAKRLAIGRQRIYQAPIDLRLPEGSAIPAILRRAVTRRVGRTS